MEDIITVQEAFRQAKAKKLAQMYLDKYISKEEISEHGIKETRKALKKHIKFLRKVPLKSDNNDEIYVFYVSHKLSADKLTTKPHFNYQRIDQLGSSFPSYGYEMIILAETLNDLIVLTWKTKYYLDELLVDIMYELSWFGYRQEKLETEKEKLDKAIKESKQGKTKNFTIHNQKDLYDMFKMGITDDDHFDNFEYRLRQKIIMESNLLIKHSIDREAAKVKKILSRNNLI